MALADSSARMRFLGQASDALAVTAPAVSSYIRATQKEACGSRDTDTSNLGDICNACGQVLLIGWSCEPVRSVKQRQTREQRINGNTVTICVRCLACGSDNVVHHKKKSKTVKSKTAGSKLPSQAQKVSPDLVDPRKKEEAAQQPAPLPAPVTMPAPMSKEQTPEMSQAKPTARRKGRGKNASLQALLANKKPEAPKSSGYGLDFMDFMK